MLKSAESVHNVAGWYEPQESRTQCDRVGFQIDSTILVLRDGAVENQVVVERASLRTKDILIRPIQDVGRLTPLSLSSICEATLENLSVWKRLALLKSRESSAECCRACDSAGR